MASQRKQTLEKNTMASSNSVVGIDTTSSLDDELMTTRDVMAFLNFSRTKIWELVQHETIGLLSNWVVTTAIDDLKSFNGWSDIGSIIDCSRNNAACLASTSRTGAVNRKNREPP